MDDNSKWQLCKDKKKNIVRYFNILLYENLIKISNKPFDSLLKSLLDQFLQLSCISNIWDLYIKSFFQHAPKASTWTKISAHFYTLYLWRNVSHCHLQACALWLCYQDLCRFFIFLHENLHSFAATADCPFITWCMLTVLYETGLIGHVTLRRVLISSLIAWLCACPCLMLNKTGLNCRPQFMAVWWRNSEDCWLGVFMISMLSIMFWREWKIILFAHCTQVVQLFTASLPQNCKWFHVYGDLTHEIAV